MKNINRRTFLKQGAVAAAALGFSAKSWSQVPGANSDVRVAVIGFHGRGQNHISEFQKIQGVRLTALCDVDKKILEAGMSYCRKKSTAVEGFADIRRLLEYKNLDAISIATPNHWHALATLWGIMAGKDVYVEKPVSHCVAEGEKMVDYARRRSRIVQSGMQSRSSQGIREAVAWVKEGKIGRILRARAICYKARPSIGKTDGPQPVPKEVDYDLWTGPAPMTPLRRKYLHYDWHWFWNYGDGDLGNQCVHEVDVVRWFLGERILPPRVFTIGGRLGYEDDGETPNTLLSYLDYPMAPLIIEVRGLPEKAGSRMMDKFSGVEIGVVIECEGGKVVVPDYKSAKAYDKDDKEIASFEGASNHFENFIHAVHTRRAMDLNADILEGHLSAALCHVSNISYRIGRRQPPEQIREEIKGNKEATLAFDRMGGHLAANNVDLEGTPPTMGAFLKINPNNEKFIQNKKATVLLSRQYRAPFIFQA